MIPALRPTDVGDPERGRKGGRGGRKGREGEKRVSY